MVVACWPTTPDPFHLRSGIVFRIPRRNRRLPSIRCPWPHA